MREIQVIKCFLVVYREISNELSWRDLIFFSIKAGVCTGENQVTSGIFTVYHERGIAYTLLYSIALDMTRYLTYLKLRNLDITDKLVEGHL